MTPVEGALQTLGLLAVLCSLGMIGYAIGGLVNGRHRQAAEALQGNPGEPGGDTGDAGTGEARIARAIAFAKFARDYAAAGGTGAGVVASKKSFSFPSTKLSAAGMVMPIPQPVQGCPICAVHPAGPGGLCAACAGEVFGQGAGRTCACGKSYSTNYPMCPRCMQMLGIAQGMAQPGIGGGAMTVARSAPKPTPLPRADMQVVDLIGWRVWRITSLGYLRSLTADVIWLPGVPMEAPAVVDTHAQGSGSGADYGVHVFKERNGAILEVENYASRSEQHVGYAVGSVLLWGDVVEHERGYRAERAKILSIDDVTWKGKPPWDKETGEVLGFLRQRYGLVPRGTDEGDAP